MRKGDTKKLSKEGSYALNLEKIIIRSFFLILFLPGILHLQTKLNNFGVSQIIKTYKEYKKFTFVDFNKDGIDDIILYGNQRKSFVIHKGIADSTFSKPERKFFFFPIDDFKWLAKSDEGEDYYIFVSRNKRLIGLVSFTKSYALQLLHTLEYKSYPSSIKIVDLNSDGKNEALIYGGNFNGIVLIENDGFRLKAKNVVSETIARDIDSIDINLDANTDFAAIDLLHNSLKFYENLGDKEFSFCREIIFDETITKVKSEYFNNDTFIDLIIAKENGLEILFGDSVLSYTKRLSINYPFSPNNFLIEDANNDNINDIILINSLKDQFVVTTGVDSVLENLAYNFQGISEIGFQKNNLSGSLVTLSNKGKIYTISNYNKWGKSFLFFPAGIPGKIDTKFNAGNSFDLIVQDRFENSVNFLSADSGGYFKYFTKVNFINTISDFTVSPDMQMIAGYNFKSRLIEIMFNGNISYSERSYLYSSFPIDDLQIDSDKNITAIETLDNKLYLQLFELTHAGYSAQTTALIDSHVVETFLKNNGVLYWSKSNDTLVLHEYSKGISNRLYQTAIGKSDSLKIMIVNNDFDYPFITIIENGSNTKILLVNDKTVKVFTIEENVFIHANNKSDFVFYKSGQKENYLIVNKPEQNLIQIFKFDFENNKMILAYSIEAKNINDYLVHQFFDKTYIIYTNQENNFITFRTIDL